MSATEPAGPEPRRTVGRRAMHVVRRLHLYLGLFLLPWAILYGVTGFLFNHPTAFSDQPTASFGRSELVGTPMENPPAPAEVATQVVAALNERAKHAKSYVLVQSEQAKYTREFAFVTVRADGREVGLLFDPTGRGGTIRARDLPAAPPTPPEKAPFAVGGAKSAVVPKDMSLPAPGLAIDAPLHVRIIAAVPVVLERTGFPGGEVTVTSVPDLFFLMEGEGKTWAVTFNALSGAVSGQPDGAALRPEELSTRRFLTRLHLASGFPANPNTKWFWAILVDATALVLVFWGISGLFMWWQVKSTRRTGILILLLSAAVAAALGFGMHDALTGR